jgi:hypothetical protein
LWVRVPPPELPVAARPHREGGEDATSGPSDSPGQAGAEIERLERWEDLGALWRAVVIHDDRAVVHLCACTGEPVDRLESDDRELIAYLRRRPASDLA